MEDKTITASKRIIPTEQEIPTLYENAIEKMLAEMPRCQTQRQAARWIYINLGKLLAYDERYTVGNRRQQIKLFRLAKERVIQFNQIKEGKKFKGICIDLNELYANLLRNRLGIPAYINFGYGPMPHDNVSAKIDGKWTSFDLQRDLINVQLNRQTQFFGFRAEGDEWCELTYKPEEVKEDDDFLRFKNYDYTGNAIVADLREKFEAIFYYGEDDDEKYIEQIRFKSLPIKERIEEMMHDISTIPHISELGYTERTRVYCDMLKWGLQYGEDRKYFRIDNLYTLDKDNLPKDVVEVFTVNYFEDQVTRHARYVYDHVKKKYVQISNRELLKRIEDEGLVSKKKIFSSERRFKKETEKEEKDLARLHRILDRNPMEEDEIFEIDVPDAPNDFSQLEIIKQDGTPKSPTKSRKTKDLDDGIDY